MCEVGRLGPTGDCEGRGNQTPGALLSGMWHEQLQLQMTVALYMFLFLWPASE